jgi:hypothetical protein
MYKDNPQQDILPFRLNFFYFSYELYIKQFRIYCL